jgi:nucleotide-binding universal stress UspA family protein
MIWLAVVVALLVAAGVVLAWRWRSPERAPNRITPGARRILFPFVGETISSSTLDAALRLARAENATLVPAYLVVVPLSLSLSAPVPGECEQAMPLLETIERRAARLHVPIDSRIETGRSARHALRQLIDQESFDRLIVPAASRTSEGFTSEDVAWLLEHAPGEIVIVRPRTQQQQRAAA